MVCVWGMCVVCVICVYVWCQCMVCAMYMYDVCDICGMCVLYGVCTMGCVRVCREGGWSVVTERKSVLD